MRREPQNGVDYLINYYGVIGVPQDTEDETIKKAWREKMRQYHPDRYNGLASEFQSRAEDMARMLGKAYEVLSDPVRRAAHDKQLAEWSGPISEDGIPIMPLFGSRYGVANLFGDQEAELEMEGLLQQARAMSGFDPSIHGFLEQQYSATDNPSVELENAYRQSLAKRDICLSLEESFHMEAIGLGRRTAPHPLADYLADTQAKVEAGTEGVVANVQQILLALHAGEVKMLGPGGEPLPIMEEVQTDPDAALVRYTERALANYSKGAEKVLELAQQRQEVINKRLALVRGEYKPEQTEFFRRLVIRLQFGDNHRWLAFSLVGEGENVSFETDEIISQEEMEELTDPEKAQVLIVTGCNIIYLAVEEGLPWHPAVEEVLNQHYALLFDDEE